ncbi:MAG TPA: phosphoglycerate dehydrogenase [Turneriella sp.]|nr:phosphoglycerate dehydrogenase [Turneriella sp.]HNJ65825.1 phosphoglycerate dehydrogenase [Turneriella sp.]HNL54265.1 phosphoglycerate dehydrogenase [Turneriella sp.]
MAKPKILISDNLDQDGVDILTASGLFEVDYRKKTSREELEAVIPEVEGLIIRSASKVDKALIEKAKNLKVVIRAGVGVDNIDIPACSQKGIVVMNAPAGNSISTAEQAIALMFALARKTPQAHGSMKEKKWEKTKFQGSQLTGKTLGVVGLGRIGKEVVKRAKGLQMKVLGFDPYIPAENLTSLEIELVPIDTILKQSDFITVHTPLTDATKGLINEKNLSLLKPGVRVINCARGGIYDEAAIVKGVKDGIIAGAGLDVFVEEPLPATSELYNFDDIILTPHLGASTDEAQIEVAKESAESMVAYFKNGVARNSLNFPTIDPASMDTLAPWFDLCERVGSFVGQMVKNPMKDVELSFRGEFTAVNLTPLEIALTKGLLTLAMGDEVNLVNAPLLAKERSMRITARKDEKTEKEPSSMTLTVYDEKERLTLKAAVGATGGVITELNGNALKLRPEGNILYILNTDTPGVVGKLGTLLGEHNINISSMELSRGKKGGEARTFLGLDDELPKALLETIQKKEFIVEARFLKI